MATLPTIVLVLLFTTGAARPVLTSNGYDKVRFGMRLTAAEVLLGEKSVAAGESGVETCRYVSFASLPHVRFMVESEVVTRAEASPGVENALHVSVGESLSSVTTKHPTTRIVPHKYDPAGHYVIFESADKKAAVVLEEEGGKITSIRAGLEPSVEYVEGCL